MIELIDAIWWAILFTGLYISFCEEIEKHFIDDD